MGMDGRQRADYGLDAPPVVRNLLIAGIGGLVVRGTATARLWSGDAGFTVAGNEVRVGIAPAGLWIGIGCLAMAAWMIWSSRVGKVRERERLLDTLTWRGDEQVLDLGCGRGLMLIGAARRLRTGRAIGVDLWRTEDSSRRRRSRRGGGWRVDRARVDTGCRAAAWRALVPGSAPTEHTPARSWRWRPPVRAAGVR
jgi:arsenite methyltransferase